jgi:hypothetical protein
MSRCDAVGCAAVNAPGRFMCLKHWRMVSVENQQTINSRYRAGRKDHAFLSDPEYLKACVSAIEAIAVREGTQTAAAWR